MPVFILVSSAKKESELESYLSKITDYNLGFWRRKYDSEQQLYEIVYKGIPLLIQAIANRLDTGDIAVGFEKFSPLDRINYDLVDPSFEEVRRIINNIQLNSDAMLIEIQWKRLEKLSINQRLWKIDEIWKLLNQKINSNNMSNLSRCLIVLRKILINSKLEKSNEVIELLQKYDLLSKLESMFLGNDINVDLKKIIKDIFTITYD